MKTKNAIKRDKVIEQDGECALTGKDLGDGKQDMSLIDGDRKRSKVWGGEFKPDNVQVAEPVEHMKDHGNHRDRDEAMDNLKTELDGRRQIMKLWNKVNSQLLAYKRGVDHVNQEAMDWVEGQRDQVTAKLKEHNRLVGHAVNAYAEYDQLTKIALTVPGLGPITVAHCTVYIDLPGVYGPTMRDEKTGKQVPHPRAGQEKCPHASSLWSYAGYDKPSHDRYEKGTSGGGNKTLRTVLFNMGDTQIKMTGKPDKNGVVKARGAYLDVYEQTKARLSVSEKMVSSRNTQGKLVKVMWKDAKPSHRHGAAMRAMAKHFLADYWFVGRTLLGLSTGPGYAEAQLGGGHRTISPAERGWGDQFVNE